MDILRNTRGILDRKYLVELDAVRRKVVPTVLGLQSMISLLYILDVGEVVYYATVHRLTIENRFDLGWDSFWTLVGALVFWMLYVYARGWRREAVVFSSPLALALFSVKLAVALTVIVFSLLVTYKEGCQAELVDGVIAILSIFYSLCLFHWLILYPLGLDSFLTYFSDLEIKLFHLGNYVIPLLVFPLFVGWLFKPYLSSFIPSKSCNHDGGSLRPRYLLPLSLLVGIVSAFYPYLNSINPVGVFVGVDADRYVKILKEMGDFSQVNNVSGGSRPFALLSIKVFQALTFMSVEDAVKFFPVVLIPLFVLSTYFIVQRVAGDDAAGWAAFLTATGSKTVVGMYSYFLSNLLAIIIIQFSLGFLFTALESGRRRPLILSSLLAALCLFTHPWTYDQYVTAVAVLTVILLYKFYRGDEVKGVVTVLVVFLGVQLGAEAIKTLLLNSYSASDAISKTVVRGLDLKLWYTSIFTFRLLYGGYLSNIFPIVLAIIGVYSLNEGELKHGYFIIFIALTFLGFLVTNETLKSRLFFNIPLEIFASLGLTILLRNVKRRKRLGTLLVAYSLVFLFRSLANLI